MNVLIAHCRKAALVEQRSGGIFGDAVEDVEIGNAAQPTHRAVDLGQLRQSGRDENALEPAVHVVEQLVVDQT